MYNKIPMNLYRVVILDRNYSNHIFYHVDDLQKGEINVDSIPGMKELRPLELRPPPRGRERIRILVPQ